LGNVAKHNIALKRISHICHKRWSFSLADIDVLWYI